MAPATGRKPDGFFFLVSLRVSFTFPNGWTVSLGPARLRPPSPLLVTAYSHILRASTKHFLVARRLSAYPLPHLQEPSPGNRVLLRCPSPGNSAPPLARLPRGPQTRPDTLRSGGPQSHAGRGRPPLPAGEERTAPRLPPSPTGTARTAPGDLPFPAGQPRPAPREGSRSLRGREGRGRPCRSAVCLIVTLRLLLTSLPQIFLLPLGR